MVVSCCYYGHGRGEDPENFVPVVTRSPDRVTRLDRRCPSTCKDKETFGRGPWHGQETIGMYTSFRRNCITGEWMFPCHGWKGVCRSAIWVWFNNTWAPQRPWQRVFMLCRRLAVRSRLRKRLGDFLLTKRRLSQGWSNRCGSQDGKQPP